ncbi:carbohydrate kinase [Solirubrobacter sp. CPCC 204708]|nr:carbohydrate kinase [Solirubrobacter deserti]
MVGGEALVDLVPHADHLAAHPGGGPYNTARTLGRLEQDVHFLGCLSDDGFGRQLRAELEADRVKLDTVVSTARPTTLALAEVDASGAASYRFYTEGTSAPALTPEAALAALPQDVDVLHVGTLGLIMEPTASALRRVVEAVADRALIMVDPNCRPTFIADRDAYREQLSPVLRHAHVVKVSGDDLEYLSPGVGMVDAARALDVPVALVTLGGDGALIVTPEDEAHVDAPKITVVDTIGAGDAFGGGFLTYVAEHGRGVLDDSEAVRAATRFACVVAARTCERAGASPPRRSDLDGDL